MNKSYRVYLSKLAQKQVKRLPVHIQDALEVWRDVIESEGIWTMRKVPGYHDEPLIGIRKEQRSSRLSRAYRVIYDENESGEVIIIMVLEVNKHDY
ncbi:MAG: type II toxin-antitoxin system RelE family toxin [Nitrospiria bacterium]